jgi:hypothetical protein
MGSCSIVRKLRAPEASELKFGVIGLVLLGDVRDRCFQRLNWHWWSFDWSVAKAPQCAAFKRVPEIVELNLRHAVGTDHEWRWRQAATEVVTERATWRRIAPLRQRVPAAETVPVGGLSRYGGRLLRLVTPAALLLYSYCCGRHRASHWQAKLAAEKR